MAKKETPQSASTLPHFIWISLSHRIRFVVCCRQGIFILGYQGFAQPGKKEYDE